MREAAADLDFEEAARLRDELKRLRQTELAVVDDPTAKLWVMAGADFEAAARGVTEAARRPDKPPAQASSRRNGHRDVARGEAGAAPDARTARASQTSMKWAPAWSSIPGKRGDGPRSTLGRPGMRGGFKPRRR